MLSKFFRNKDGKLVIWQFPNAPLLGGLACTLLARLVSDVTLHHGLHSLSTAFFFTWAYLELRYGESLFRRILGAIVLTSIIATYFR